MRRGFAQIVVIAIILIILAVGGALGYLFFQKEKSATQSTPPTSTSEIPTSSSTSAPTAISLSSKIISDKEAIFTKDLGNKVQVFKLSLQSKEPTLLFEVQKQIQPYNKQLESPVFEVAKNVIVYSFPVAGGIFIWNGQSVNPAPKMEGYSPGHSLSPDGQTVLLIEGKDNLNDNTSPDVLVTQKFYKSSINKPEPEFLYEETLKTQGGNETGGYTAYTIVGWLDNSKVLLQKHADLQLHQRDDGLYELDINTKKFSQKLPFEGKTYLSEDGNGRNFVAVIRDEACCGGINYSNDQTFVIDQTGKESKIFDEYSTYNNKEKTHTEEHLTDNAYFSPGNKYIAQTIANIFAKCDPGGPNSNSICSAEDGNPRDNPPTLMVTNFDGKDVFKKEGVQALGWLNPQTLLVKNDISYVKHSDALWDYVPKSNGIAALNIETGELSIITKEDFDEAWVK